MAKVAAIQNNFNGGEISPLLYGRPDVDRYKTGLKTCLNFIPLVQGPVERRPGTVHITEVKTSSAATRIVRFEFSTSQAYIIEFGNNYCRFIKDRAQIVSGTPVELATTYTTAELFDLKFAQSADILYVVHPDHPPRKISRTSDTAWSITDITFSDGPFLNTNVTTTTLGLSATTGTVTVTASAVTGINDDAGFASTDVGRQIRWKDAAGDWTFLTITVFTSTTVVTAVIDGPDASATTATINWRLGVWSATTGYPAAITFHQNRLAFAGPTDNPQRVDLSRTGDFENFAPTEPDATVVDDNGVTNTLSADTVNAIRWLADDEKGLLIGTVGGEWVMRPSDTGAVLTPSTVQSKRSSAYGSANIQPIRAGRAVIFAQKALRKLRELAYVFEDDGFRAPDLTLISEHITRTGVVDMAYQSEPQSLIWVVLTDGTLVCLTYDRDQKVVGWSRHVVGGVSDAGSTQAKVESVAVIPNAEGTADELYAVVQRHIDGASVRYIEYLKPLWDGINDQEDAFFVDSGLSLDVPLTITGITQADPAVVTATSHGFSDGDEVRITEVEGMTEVNKVAYIVANKTTHTFELTDRDGNDIDSTGFTAYVQNGEVRERVLTLSNLSHLEGETVQILAEGATHADKTVTSGSVTLDRKTSKAHVGLPYVSDFEMLRLDVGAQDGTSQGKFNRFHRVIIRFLTTLGGFYGPDTDSLDQISFREGGDPMDTAVPLFTGDLELEWDGAYDSDNHIFYRQTQPLPVIIQAVMPQMITQDR